MQREYVGIDLHRRRSVIVRKSTDGEVLSKVRIDNDPLALAATVGAAGPEPEVVLEATFGWYWAAVEAASKNHAGGPFKDAYRQIAERRGRNIAKVAAGRKLLTLVYYGLRDGEIRCLAQPERG